MAFRNPLAGDLIFDPLTGQLKVNAADIIGFIEGSQLAADSIDGKTITGATIRTAAVGARWEMGEEGFGSYLFGYGGDPLELQSSYILATTDRMTFKSPLLAGESRATLDLITGPVPEIQVVAGIGTIGPISWDASNKVTTIGDIDWTLCTPAPFSNSLVEANRVDGLVSVRGTWAPNAAGTLTSTYVTLATLPADTWPALDVHTDIVVTTAMTIQVKIYAATGIIQMRTFSTAGTAYTTSSFLSLEGRNWRVY